MVEAVSGAPSQDLPDHFFVVASGYEIIHLDGGEVTFSIEAASGNMAEMMYEVGRDAVGNGGGAV
jgi:hypothetical protein